MNTRFLHQAAALIACAVLIVMLTLSIMNKVSTMVFWLTALACLGLVYLLRKE